MSLESALRFVTAMTRDSQLLDRVRQATEGVEGDQRSRAVVSIGTEEGYDFTFEEVAEVKGMMMQAETLSDDELEQVSGGTLTASFEDLDQPVSQQHQMLSSLLRSMDDTESISMAKNAL